MLRLVLTAAEGLPVESSGFLSWLTYAENVLSKLGEKWFGMACRKMEKKKVW